MRKVATLCLLFFVASCAAPGQPLVEVPAVAVQATPAPAQEPTAAPAQAQPASLAESVVLAYSRQGKQEMLPVDPATGEALPGYEPIPAAPLAYSPDGMTVAAIESEGDYCEPYQGGSACRARASALHLVDLSSWRDTSAPLSPDGWVAWIAFSPDGSRLALALNSRDGNSVLVADGRTGEIIARHDISFRPAVLGFGPDGAPLVVYGAALGEDRGISKPGVPTVQLLDADSLAVEWEHTFPDLLSGEWCLEDCDHQHGMALSAGWGPAVVLARDGQALYIVHADEEVLTTVDLAARSVSSQAIQVEQSWVEQLLARTAGVAQAKGGVDGAYKQAVLSPDGTRLYLSGQTMHSTRDDQGLWQFDQEFLGLQAIDVATGHLLATHDTEAWQVSVAPDGRHVFLTIWYASPWTEVVDADSLETIATIADWQVVAGRRINGQPILLASKSGDRQSKLAVIDPASFEVANSWTAPSYDTWLPVP